MDPSAWPLLGAVLIVVATCAVGIWGSRSARTTSDLSTARRPVGAERNAAAISGEYLSAASFLGVAGLVFKDGVDALWYPIGFVAGYLALLLFAAAPLRRSGAYTLPDFATARLDSVRLRTLCTWMVVVVGCLYLVPQLQGAGMALAAITGVPYWVGVLGIALVVLVSVGGGVLRAATLVQGFQYWVKLFAIAAPAFVLFGVHLASGQPTGLGEPAPPVFKQDTEVSVQTPVRVEVAEPVWLSDSGATAYLGPGSYEVQEGSSLRFPAGSPTPVVSGAEASDADWLLPQADGFGGVFSTYSVLVATFLGAMGLPHVLARFYTNPSGHGARRTTLYVLAMLGTFSLFPVVFGLLSRVYAPQLLLTGQTDAAVLALPELMLGGPVGGVLAAITAAGAFSAFLAASSGLVVSVAGVVSTDVLRGVDFRLVLVPACLLPALLAMPVDSDSLAGSVELAFAMAASTFAPLLVLGIWWRGLTAAGAGAGMVTGGGLVLVAVLVRALAGERDSWWGLLASHPALVTVPLAFLVAVVVSRATRGSVPPGVGRIMLRLHAPDRLGFRERNPSAAQRPARGRHAR